MTESIDHIPNDENDPAVGQRLRRLRELLGYKSQTDFVAYLGISLQRWNNIERGYQDLGKELAIMLVKKVPGLTLDWLLLGKADGLPLGLARRLGELGELPTLSQGVNGQKNPDLANKIESAVRQNADLIAQAIMAGEGEDNKDD
jgi:transcriptional regulator with XRE-family HTH domain